MFVIGSNAAAIVSIGGHARADNFNDEIESLEVGRIIEEGGGDGFLELGFVGV